MFSNRWLYFGLVFFAILGELQAQRVSRTSFGIHYTQFLPEAILSTPVHSEITGSGHEVTTTNLTSGGFGMGFRKDFKGLLGFETGLMVANKNFSVQVQHSDSGFNHTFDFKFQNFHVPLLGRVNLKINDHWNVNALFGFSFVVLPTDVEFATDEVHYRSFRNTWLKVGLEGMISLTYWLKSGGALELAAGTQQPFDRLAVGVIDIPSHPNQPIHDIFASLGQIRLSYYFHEDVERKYKRKK